MLMRLLVSLLVVVPAASFAPLAGPSTIKLRPATLRAVPHPARGPTAGFRMLSMQSKPEATEQLAVPLTLLRVAAGVLMIHHGSEGGVGPANVGTEAFNGFVDFVMKPYFSWLPGSLVFWAAVHDLAEFFGGISLALGLLTRYSAGILSATMAMAVYFHLASTGLEGAPLGHVKNYSYNFEEPFLYLCIFLLFAFSGGGPLSVDGILANKDPEA